MRSRDPTARMWSEACRLLEEAESLHRQFFRLESPRGRRVAWEPPVDVFEDEQAFVVLVALPGVEPRECDAAIEARTLVIRAERRIPFAGQDCAIQRLEIPYGCFERRITLPAIPLELDEPQWANGCLMVRIRKVG
jgi:HSP20 family protein